MPALDLPFKTSCPTRLVTDEPAQTDRFGPHAELAQSIRQLIEHETGGRTIGLAGPYGSGKSTVVTLLRNLLQADPGNLVWVFDAWAHEGDPLRRSFLESMTHAFVAQGWVSEDEWKKHLETLARKRKLSRSTITPEITTAGWALAASALLPPLGTVLLGSALRETATLALDWTLPVHWGAVVSALLVIAPILVLLATLVYSAARNTAAESLLAQFVSKAATEHTTQTVESPEPTSLEFESIFNKLIKEALGDRSRRAVLVVDNLDRVSPAHAQALLSTLQTFLQVDKRSEHVDRLWVVLPYAPDGLTDPHKGEGPATNDFLEKRFQVRFEVPPPVLSNWREYLLSLLRHAFPVGHEPDFHTIYRLVAVSEHFADSPTPRQVIALVNQIGALHRTRGHTVSLASICYFVLARARRLKILEGLRKQTLPDARSALLLPPNIRDELAALEFGVPIELARHLLLEGPIRSSLERGDGGRLSSIGLGDTSFLILLDHVLGHATSEWLTSEPTTILSAAQAIRQSGLLGRDSLSDNIVRTIELALLRIHKWPDYSTAGAVAMEHLQPLGISSQAIRASFKALAGVFLSKEWSREEPDADEIRVLYDDAFVLNETHEAALGTGLPAGFIRIPGGLRGLTLLAELADEELDRGSDNAWAWFAPVDPSAITRQLINLVAEGKLTTANALTVRLLRRSRSEEHWKPLVTAVQARLAAGQASQAPEISALLGILLELRPWPESLNALRDLREKGHLGHHLHALNAAGDKTGAARCLLGWLESSASLEPGAAIGNSTSGYQTLQHIKTKLPADTIESLSQEVLRFNLGATLFSALPNAGNALKLLGGVVSAIQSDEEAVRPLAELLDTRLWMAIEPLVAPSTLTAVLGNQVDLVRRRLASDPFDARAATLYMALCNSQQAAEIDAFVEWCVRGLESTDRQVWLAQLTSSPAPLLALAIELSGRGKRPSLTGEYRAALTEFANASFAEGGEPEAGWAPILDLLDVNHRTALMDLVVRRLCENASTVADAFLEGFGSHLVRSQEFRSRASECVTDLFVPLIESRRPARLAWVERFLDDNAGWSDELPSNYRAILSDACQTLTADERRRYPLISATFLRRLANRTA